MQSDDDLFEQFLSKYSPLNVGHKAYIAAIHENFPDPDAYYRFCRARSRASFEKLFTAISPDSFGSAAQLAPHRAAWPRRRGHALPPDSRLVGLDPSTPLPEPTAASGLKLLPGTLLGVNTVSGNAAATCAPSPRHDCHSAISTLSADSDDDSNGFCFCQLGTLESLPGNLDLPIDQFEDCWHNTGFVVVIRTTASGAADGIYIIISNQPLSDDDDDDAGIGSSEVSSPPKPVSHPGASLWESPPEPLFSCARANGITKLADCNPDYGTLLSWVDRVYNPVEIVPAVLNWKGFVLRATVEEL